MAKKSITTEILETAVDIKDHEQKLNALLSACHSLQPEDGAVILAEVRPLIDDLSPEKKVIWLARYNQHETRLNKAIKEANNG